MIYMLYGTASYILKQRWQEKITPGVKNPYYLPAPYFITRYDYDFAWNVMKYAVDAERLLGTSPHQILCCQLQLVEKGQIEKQLIWSPLTSSQCIHKIHQQNSQTILYV